MNFHSLISLIHSIISKIFPYKKHSSSIKTAHFSKLSPPFPHLFPPSPLRKLSQNTLHIRTCNCRQIWNGKEFIVEGWALVTWRTGKQTLGGSLDVFYVCVLTYVYVCVRVVKLWGATYKQQPPPPFLIEAINSSNL